MSEEKLPISQEELEELKNSIREENGYDEMSEEEQAEFDEKVDKYCDESFEVKDDPDDPDDPEPTAGKEKEEITSEELEDVVSDLKKDSGYDEMSEEEQAEFDNRLAEVINENYELKDEEEKEKDRTDGPVL